MRKLTDEQKFLKKIGHVIRVLRKEKGYTQDELAHEANIGKSFIGYIERGQKAPTITTLYHICRALDVQLSEFFDYVKNWD